MDISEYKGEDLLLKIKRDMPNFDREEILEFTKIIIPNIHYFFSNGKEDKLNKYCTDNVIRKVLENKQAYRISKDIDNVRVGYERLEDYKNENNKMYIKVYSSVFFYDEASNNENNWTSCDKYWNDIWVVTYEDKFEKEIINKCPNCGAFMEYNKSKHMFTCNYCKNDLYYSQINWRIVDIDANGINYK